MVIHAHLKTSQNWKERTMDIASNNVIFLRLFSRLGLFILFDWSVFLIGMLYSSCSMSDSIGQRLPFPFTEDNVNYQNMWLFLFI